MAAERRRDPIATAGWLVLTVLVVGAFAVSLARRSDDSDARPGPPASAAAELAGNVEPTSSAAASSRAADGSDASQVTSAFRPDVPIPLWVDESTGIDGDVWAGLVADFPNSGRWPLALVDDLITEGSPWITGDLDPSAMTSAGEHDAADVLEAWTGERPDLVAVRSELPTFRPSVVELPGASSVVRLGLAEVERPADVPAAIGWLGAVNYHADLGEMGAVLRSWEDRYGAVLTQLGSSTMVITVTQPPTTFDEARALAAEHAGWCPTFVEFGLDLDEYASSLIDAAVWACWWD